MRTPAYMLGFLVGAFAAQGVYWVLAVGFAMVAVDLVRWAVRGLSPPRRGGYIVGRVG